MFRREEKDWCAWGRIRIGVQGVGEGGERGGGGVSYSFNWVTAGILSFLNK